MQQWIAQKSEIQTFLIVNFQFAIQSEEDLKRLNFSRDMLAGLEKNLIFLTTAYGDDQLAGGAYDFYSFVKIRIIFHTERKEQQAGLPFSETDHLFIAQETLNPEESKKCWNRASDYWNRHRKRETRQSISTVKGSY